MIRREFRFLHPKELGEFTLESSEGLVNGVISCLENGFLRFGPQKLEVKTFSMGDRHYFSICGQHFCVEELRADHSSAQTGDSGEIRARMPSRVLKVLVSEGQAVSSQDLLLVLESMKMETRIYAPFNAKVKSLSVAEGQLLGAEEVMLDLEAVE